MDVVRGCAFCTMFVYHALWFATDHGLLDVDFMSLPVRIWQRSIAGTFFFLVGVSLQLAAHVPFSRSLSRLGRLAGGAAIVTVTSIVLDPARIVVFGVLHAILVSSIIGRAFVGRGAWVAGLGALLTTFGSLLALPSFDTPWLAWTGLGTRVPVTFDHQPFVLWFGVVLMGIAAAQVMPDAVWSWRSERAEPLAMIGRHSLLLYMAHVPVLEGVFWVLS